MDKETFFKTGEYFIRLVRFGASGGEGLPPEKPKEVSWRDILLLSEKHSLAALTYSALSRLEKKPDGETAEKWEHAYRVGVHADIQQEFAWEEIKERFSKEGIKLLPLKGILLKSLYPEPAFRSMGDLDILYEEKDFEKIKALMRESGYEYRKESAGSNHQIFFRPPVTTVELHRTLLNETSPFAEYYKDVWRRALPTAEPFVCELSREDEYIFLLIHGHKHFSGAGSGVRTILDFWLYLKRYGKELDRKYIAAELSRAQEIARRSAAPSIQEIARRSASPHVQEIARRSVAPYIQEIARQSAASHAQEIARQSASPSIQETSQTAKSENLRNTEPETAFNPFEETAPVITAETAAETEASLEEFEKTLKREIILWFSAENPTLDETGVALLSDGVYGRIEKLWDKGLKEQGKGRYLTGRLFPPYKVMKQRYTLLEKLPFLLPFFWIWRLIRAAFCRRKAAAAEYRYIREKSRKEKKSG